MNIFLHGHDYRYAVEQLLLTLYPNERPVYPTEPTRENSVTVTLHRGERFAVATCILRRRGFARGQARIGLGKLSDPSQARRLEQRIVKTAFYRAALALGQEKPAWGCLTGVRPAKFFTGLVDRDGLTPAQAERALIRDFDVDPVRARLCARAAAAADTVSAALGAQDVCLYIGIPYCPTRCAYCSFVSVDAPRLLKTIPAYLDAIDQELGAVARAVEAAQLRVVSIYVGGGTPTTLSAAELDRLLGTVRRLFDLTGCREFTVEAGRPDTVTAEKLAVLRAHGVGRVSVNPQTMSDEVLAAIGRRHTAQQVREAVAMVNAAGGFALNMDLIAGLPGDTPSTFATTFREVLDMDPENITIHTLALKKGSKFLTEGAALPGAKSVGIMLDLASDGLAGAGYAPYYLYRQKFMSGSFENVGWTRPGFENLYNICIMEELCSILAAGAGGSTKLVAPGGVVRRIMNPKYPCEYLDHIDAICAAKAGILAFFPARREETTHGLLSDRDQ